MNTISIRFGKIAENFLNLKLWNNSWWHLNCVFVVDVCEGKLLPKFFLLIFICCHIVISNTILACKLSSCKLSKNSTIMKPGWTFSPLQVDRVHVICNWFWSTSEGRKNYLLSMQKSWLNFSTELYYKSYSCYMWLKLSSRLDNLVVFILKYYLCWRMEKQNETTITKTYFTSSTNLPFL